MDEMNCWEILAIEPTSDEKTIKKAYAVQLKDNRPDKNKEGFLILRTAYEEALENRFWISQEFDDDYYENKEPIEEPVIEQKYTASTSDSENKTYECLQPINYLNEITVISPDEQKANDDYLVEPYSTPESTNTNYNSSILDIPDWESVWNNLLHQSDQEQIDKKIRECLTAQFIELNELPLDEIHEFEQELINWFDDIDLLLHESFSISCQQFQWRKRLNSWEAHKYPWSILQNLVDSYDYSDLNSKEAIQKYLSDDYPNMYEFCLSEQKIKNNIRFFDFFGKSVVNTLLNIFLSIHSFIKLFNPFHVFKLACELKKIKIELYDIENTSQGKIKADQWRKSSSLVTIDESIFDKGLGNLINKKYYITWLSITAVAWFFSFLSGPSNFDNYFYDSLGALFVLTIFLTIRKIVIKQLLDDNNHGLNPQQSKAYTYLFIIFSITSVFLSNISNLYEVITVNNTSVNIVRIFNQLFSYDNQINLFFANIFALLASVVLSLFLRTNFKLFYWYYILATAINMLLIPIITPIKDASEQTTFNGPILWLFISSLFIIRILSVKFTWLKHLILISSALYVLLGILSVLILIRVIILSIVKSGEIGCQYTGISIAVYFAISTYYAIYCIDLSKDKYN